MFVVFGASTDIGQRLGSKLLANNLPVRLISRSMSGRVFADLETGDGLKWALDGAEVVISCAHARHTNRLIANLPTSVRRIVLVGSAWRYSRIPNPRADEVRFAERQFLNANVAGVMLHSAMIYGGHHENNVQRLLRLIQKLPAIPAPGGGRHQVQPIYVEDVVSCLFASAQRNWKGPNVLPIAGPALTWRDMVLQCAAGIDRRPVMVSIPATPIVAALSVLQLIGISPINPDVIRRFGENVEIPLPPISQQLGVSPRDFGSGLALAIADWRRNGTI